MEFSEDIKQLLKDKFPDKDIYSMSKDELIQFREEVVELREEYNLLEQAMKSLGNAAYGAAANQYFYFFNVELAGDITGECRNLTLNLMSLCMIGIESNLFGFILIPIRHILHMVHYLDV